MNPLSKVSDASGTSPLADEQLIRRAASGDAEAFRRLVTKHQSQVRGLLLRLTGFDPQRTDELAQDVFLTMYETLSSFRFESSLSTWLYRLTSRHFVDDQRRRKSRIVEVSIETTPEPIHCDTERLDLRKSLRAALAQLKDEERMAIVLTGMEELTFVEAAEAMDVPLGTLKTHVFRGKEHMKTFLRQNGYEVEL